LNPVDEAVRGRALRISTARKLVVDLMHFARQVPSVAVQKRMQLTPIRTAMAACPNRPTWVTVFTKAYAMVCAEYPELRRAYVKFPWPHFFEDRESIAAIAIEREYEGELIVLGILLKRPEVTPLRSLNDQVRHAQVAPVREVKAFDRALRLGALPRPLRRFLMWLALNLGPYRSRYLGTFAVTIFASLSAQSHHALSASTTLLTYGVFDATGLVDVRLTFDHRVVDGAVIARVLGRLETVLNTTMVAEIQALAEASAEPSSA
jgi:hypothetical protein